MMKKRFFAAALSAVMICSIMTGCGTKAKENGTDGGKTYKIGVCQLTKHDALDSAYKGFKDGLAEAGYEEGKNITFDYQVGNGDQSDCQPIATKLVNDNDDLILAIGTNAAQACANATADIPIVITAVTDPASSGLVASNEKPGNNVTGTSDLTPVKEQMDLLTKLLPDAKTVGVLYCSNESNSKIQGDMAVEALKDLGLSVEEATVSQTSEIQSVVEALVSKVDVIYSPTDNMIANNMATVSMLATANKIPIICGEEGMVKSGGFATKGLSYYNLGKQTAAMAVKILEDKEKPAAMPIEYIENIEFYYNEEVAEQLGITIPEELLAK